MATASEMFELEMRKQGLAKRGPVELMAMPEQRDEISNVQLPLWPEPVRGVPNSVLRSALFGAIRRGKRAYQDGGKKASVDGVTVVHTGPQLDQADLDVWEQCLHLARTGGLGVEIRFTGHGFLKAIGRGTGKSQHEWLKSALRRLMTSLVEMQDGKKAYAGQLIHHWYRDEETGHHVMELNPKIAAMYGSNGWTQVEWEQRQALKKQPLAQWLHGFYSTHAAPYPMKVETIHRLSGSEAKQVKHFRAELREALTKMEAATKWTWEIDSSDLVQVNKKPTASQARHLIRQIIKGTG
ncbi:MAG: plasmid replication initiator TrfA [Halothiobacillaceae bacterium]